jgi:hypothetical protein
MKTKEACALPTVFIALFALKYNSLPSAIVIFLALLTAFFVAFATTIDANVAFFTGDILRVVLSIVLIPSALSDIHVWHGDCFIESETPERDDANQPTTSRSGNRLGAFRLMQKSSIGTRLKKHQRRTEPVFTKRRRNDG